jgi:hypothetical protein
MGRSASFLKTTSGGSGQRIRSCQDILNNAKRWLYVHTNWVLVVEPEKQLEGLVEVERVGIKDLDVQSPCLKIVCRDKSDARRKRLLDLYENELSAQ